ncbi:CAU/MBL1b family subclass B3 metallo-beta-lactamase [Massilia terrae]|uniref:Subclass B3 metallo-beta-lactamase n=1 Tax=Massilia terrae TaxID=1811224 RepID=A0ABT2CXE7_9BURK|nr:subclass B3 metallo-beta-lactamase [Massilia terrae]MCS0658646.1 subclass B3 metallo-beta-lactamase [Massilia terrae]
MKRWAAFLLGMAAAAGAAHAQEGAVHCDACDDWNKPQAPFQVYGNTWYVGVHGLSALLVTGPQGHILLDGGLPQSAPQIRKNIEALGFRIEDVKLILNSHSHWDHSGGIPALQRASGAQVAASAWSAKEMAAGANIEGDPQYDPAAAIHVEKIAKVKIVADGETVSVGPLKLTAHLTPGHTPGSTAWTWQSCEQGACRNIVYADSLTPVSSDGFYFTGDATHPDITASFRASVAKLGALPCDVIVSTHPGFTDTFDKLAKRTPSHNTFVEPGGCKALAEESSRNLDKRIATERADKAKRR